jgi:antitoxin HigA-1
MERKLKRTHPGHILRMELVDGQNLSVTKVAELLNTTRANMSNILNGHASISPNMALRIETVFGGSAAHFIRLQSTFDLEKAKIDFMANPPLISRYTYA